jgi:hypothetical protein
VSNSAISSGIADLSLVAPNLLREHAGLGQVGVEQAMPALSAEDAAKVRYAGAECGGDEGEAAVLGANSSTDSRQLRNVL